MISREEQLARLRGLQGNQPQEVPSAYVPSGKSSAKSIPMLFVGSLLGWLVGSLATAALVGLVALCFYLIGQMGRCSVWIYFGLLLLFFAAPLAIPIAQGFFMGIGAKWGRCRSVPTTQIAAAILALMTTALMLFVVGPLLTMVGEWQNVSMKSCDFFGPAMLDDWYKLVGYGVVMGLLSLFISVSMAGNAVREHKFCERCEEYLEEKPIARFPLEHTKALLLGLLERNGAAIWPLQPLPEKADWSDEDDRIEFEHAVCRCQATHFIEAKIYWTHKKVDSKGQEERDSHSRRVYSEALSPQDATASIDLLTRPRTPVATAATPSI